MENSIPQFNLLDIGFCVVVLLFAVRGGLQGFIKEVTGLIAIIAGVIFSSRYYTIILPSVKQSIAISPFGQNCIAYGLTFIGILLFVGIAGKILSAIMTLSFTAWVEHALGVGVGICKGILVNSFALAILLWLVPNSPFLTDSFFSVYLKSLIDIARTFLPPAA